MPALGVGIVKGFKTVARRDTLVRWTEIATRDGQYTNILVAMVSAGIVLLQLQMMCSQKNSYNKCNKIHKIMTIIT